MSQFSREKLRLDTSHSTWQHARYTHSKIARRLCERIEQKHFVINWKFQFFEFLVLSWQKKKKLFKRGGFSKLGGMTVQRGCSCPFMKYLESLALLSLVAAAGHFLLAYSKGKSASVQTAPPRLPRLVLTQVLLISQLSNLTIITWLSFVYVKTTYPTGNIRLIISSPSKLHGALAADGQ